MRSAAIGVILAVLVVASVGVGYLAGNNARSTKTLTSTPTFIRTPISTSMSTVATISVPGAAATAVGSNGGTGVDLVLAVNATTLKVGQSLNVSVSLFNTLPSTNSILNSTGWDFQGVPVALWPPCYVQLPVEAVVLKGNYTLQALHSAANYTFNYTCSQVLNVVLLTFQRMSSLATLTAVNAPESNANFTIGPNELSLSFATNGYWDLLNSSQQLNGPIIGQQQSPPRPPVATPFVPGVYTVAIADEWGQAAVLYFTVTG